MMNAFLIIQVILLLQRRDENSNCSNDCDDDQTVPSSTKQSRSADVMLTAPE